MVRHFTSEKFTNDLLSTSFKLDHKIKTKDIISSFPGGKQGTVDANNSLIGGKYFPDLNSK